MQNQLEHGTHVINLIISQHKPNRSNSFRGGRQTGILDYSGSNVATLLKIIEEVELICSNQCATVAEKYKEYATDNSRPPQDKDALKAVFHQMVNVKKSTHDPSFSESAKLEKHFVKSILCKIILLHLQTKVMGKLCVGIQFVDKGWWCLRSRNISENKAKSRRFTWFLNECSQLWSLCGFCRNLSTIDLSD